MRASTAQFAEAVIRQLGEEGALNCSVEKVLEMFDFDTVKTVSKRSVAAKKVRAKQSKAAKAAAPAKTAKPEMILPFCGEIVEDWCKGVRFNHGLHTQCTNAMADGRYCKTCTKSATNSASSKPTYGDIDDRAQLGLEYRDPKGKQTVPYANVAEKSGLDIEAAKAAAAKMGWTIPEAQLVKRTVQRGRPGKSAAASDTSSEGSAKLSIKVKRGRKPKVVKVKTQQDLIAKLVSEAAADALSVSSSTSANSKKEASRIPSQGSKPKRTPRLPNSPRRKPPRLPNSPRRKPPRSPNSPRRKPPRSPNSPRRKPKSSPRYKPRRMLRLPRKPKSLPNSPRRKPPRLPNSPRRKPPRLPNSPRRKPRKPKSLPRHKPRRTPRLPRKPKSSPRRKPRWTRRRLLLRI